VQARCRITPRLLNSLSIGSMQRLGRHELSADARKIPDDCQKECEGTAEMPCRDGIDFRQHD